MGLPKSLISISLISSPLSSCSHRPSTPRKLSPENKRQSHGHVGVVARRVWQGEFDIFKENFEVRRQAQRGLEPKLHGGSEPIL